MIPDELLRNMLTPRDAEGKCYGVVVGIVTNNRDPDNMHRVKVRFPWLSQNDESNWARVASFMTGNDRGAYFLPEVDDEVLLAFEHGSIEHPYVVGSLWNGRDQPHESNQDGANDNRSIKSRSGHVIRLCDKAGDEKIEVIDKTGDNKIVISASGNRIVVEATGDIEITSQTGNIKLNAIGIELKAQANVDITANAQVNIKGGLVNIN
jgi:uncharacterized protein involved in type VI secretion and phage assembly